MENYELSHVAVLEAEPIRSSERSPPRSRGRSSCSRGKDSIAILRLSEKAFWPGPIPFPLMHVDTGQNFPAVIEFRDRIVADLGARSSSRRCRRRSTGAASSKRPRLAEDEAGFEATARYRTVGDMSCTSGLRSRAATIEEVVAEIAATRVTERGETRADDRIAEAAMENRKREGYFFR